MRSVVLLNAVLIGARMVLTAVLAVFRAEVDTVADPDLISLAKLLGFPVGERIAAIKFVTGVILSVPFAALGLTLTIDVRELSDTEATNTNGGTALRATATLPVPSLLAIVLVPTTAPVLSVTVTVAPLGNGAPVATV
jgi:hypothetical protein